MQLQRLAYGWSDAGFGFPQHIPPVFQISYETSGFNANGGLQIQSADNCRNVQVVFLRELSRAQPVVTIGAGAVMLCAERDGGCVWGLLADPVWAGVRRFYTSR
jgi:hypothetical protein